jgi:hypothetical protein
MGTCWSEISGASRMQRDEVDECLAPSRQLCKLPRLIERIIHSAEHHILERHAPVECACGIDDIRQRVFDVDWHELPAQLIGWRMNRQSETELLGPLR